MLALIGFDAASREIVDELLAEGRLPRFAELRASGTELRLDTPATHFPAAVYPSIWSGVPLRQHGVHFPFMWSAPEQRVRFHENFALPTDLWERLAARGVRSVVLDAYESRVPKSMDGLYVRGWQFRNRVVLQPAEAPPGSLRRWEQRFGRAPRGEEVFGRPDERRLRRLAESLVAAPSRLADLAVAAVREIRPDVLVASIPAVHIAGHQLWDPAAVLVDTRPETAAELRAALRRIYVEADTAMGRIVDALPSGSDVVLFSGLGMAAETSRQDVLAPLLGAVLDGPRPEGRTRAWDFRGRIPVSLRARVADLLPDRVAMSITTALELRGVDWSATRAFVLPSDTIGYIRLNLRGRERDGIVAPEDADALVEEIQAGLREFTLPSGAPAVAAVERTPERFLGGTGSHLLPDLLVRWSDEQARPFEVLTSRSFGSVRRPGVGSGRSGNHTADAWALVVPGGGRVRSRDGAGDIVDLAATALARFGIEHDGERLLEVREPVRMTGLDSDGLRLDERGEAWTSLRRHAALGLGGKVLEVATLVALVTLLPRAFGAADFGAFALALSVVMLASTSVALGGPTLASRFLADVSPEQRPALARGIAERSATWRLGAVGVAGLVVLVVLVVRPDLVPVTAAVFVLVAVALDAAATLVLQVGLALGAARAWAARYPLQNTVLVVAALVGYAAFGRTGALAALPLASGAALVLALVSTLPHLRGVQAARALPHGLGRFAVVQSLSGLGVQVVHRGGAIAVAILGGTDAEVGFAALAAGIATAATYVVWQVYSLELPRVARQEAGAAFRATAHLTRIAIVVAAPVALVAVLLCPTVVPAVLGSEYEDAVPAIALALAILPLAPGTAALNQVAALRMVPEVRLAAVTIGLAAFVVTVALAVPAHGAVGAAAALVLGSAVALAVAAVPRRPLVDRPLVAVSLAAAAAVVALAVAW